MPCEPETTPVQVKVPLDLPPGVPPLTSLYLYIAGACNLACRHCWITPTFQPDGNSDKFIKLEYVRKAIEEAKPLGLHSVKLTGGEPTLHPQFRQLVALIADASLDIIIETNGTLIDTSLAEFLREKRVCFISVSLDGANAKTHEALRLVEGSYQRAIDGIGALVAAGFRPQMICTLHRGNVSQIEDVVRLAENLGCGSVKFNHVQHVGRGDRFAQDHGLSVPEIIDIYRRIEAELVPVTPFPIHFDIPIAFHSIRKLNEGNLGQCNMQNILGMLSGGELSLCGIGVSVSELIYGNIKSDELRKIWLENPQVIALRDQIPTHLEGICAQCVHRDFCQGSCVANNFFKNDRLTASYYICETADRLALFPASRKKVSS